jgi:hypothetical protein
VPDNSTVLRKCYVEEEEGCKPTAHGRITTAGAPMPSKQQQMKVLVLHLEESL